MHNRVPAEVVDINLEYQRQIAGSAVNQKRWGGKQGGD